MYSAYQMIQQRKLIRPEHLGRPQRYAQEATDLTELFAGCNEPLGRLHMICSTSECCFGVAVVDSELPDSFYEISAFIDPAVWYSGTERTYY